MAPDLESWVRSAAGPPPEGPLDVDRLREGARRRLRARRATAVAAVCALALLAWPALNALRPASVDLAAGGGGELVQAAAAPGAPALTAAASAQQPAVLPAGYRRCEGPAAAGAVVVTRFCADEGAPLVLSSGPHAALDELGDPIAVGSRTGFVRLEGEVIVLTVSDRDSMEDVHHRLTGPATLTPALLAEVLASIPTIPGD